MNLKIAPSILSSDFARLAESIAAAEEGGADWIHVDVMDGHFVPNITLGPPVVSAIRKVTDLPLDVHLMIQDPDRYIDAFADAGADVLTVHQEAATHLHRTLDAIRQRDVKAGVAINPATPAMLLSEALPFLDMVLVMSVNPGFGGQRFIQSSVEKVREVRRMLVEGGHTGVDVEVDGGIDPSTAGDVVKAGASVLVAGAAVYRGNGSVHENIQAIRTAAG